MSNFNLRVLGTASAMPMSDRYPSAQMLQVHGRLFLIDCGEGTQQQMRKAHLSFMRIEAIFISHIHGDHVFGLFGLLNSLAMYGRVADLYIYGPRALGSIVKFYQSFFGEGSNYSIIFREVSCRGPQLVHESRHVRVTAFPLDHKIECYGWRFDEILTPRAVEAGRVPSSYAYCSDTRSFPELADWLKGVRTLYHEATYTDDMQDKAEFRYHSTTRQAAACALQAGAERLLVGHYSSRITDFDAYLAECRELFPATHACQDGDSFEI